MDLAFVVITDRLAERGHPNPAFRVAEHLENFDIRQTVGSGKSFEIRPIESADTRFGADPDESILVLCDAIDGRAGQALRNIVMGITIFLA